MLRNYDRCLHVGKCCTMAQVHTIVAWYYILIFNNNYTQLHFQKNRQLSTWINLLVVRHSIGIYNGLKPLRKLVCPIKSWWLLTSSHAIQNGWYSSPTALCATPQCLLNLIQVTNWTPALGNKTFLSHIQIEHVHGVINGLDLLNLVMKISDWNKFHLSDYMIKNVVFEYGQATEIKKRHPP